MSKLSKRMACLRMKNKKTDDTYSRNSAFIDMKKLYSSAMNRKLPCDKQVPRRTSIYFLQESVRFHFQYLRRQCIILASLGRSWKKMSESCKNCLNLQESCKEHLNLQKMSDLTDPDRFCLKCKIFARFWQILSDMFHFCKILARNVWQFD